MYNVAAWNMHAVCDLPKKFECTCQTIFQINPTRIPQMPYHWPDSDPTRPNHEKPNLSFARS